MAAKTYPRLGWDEYAQAVQAYENLRREERELGAKLGEQPQRQRRAQQADDTAQAAALRAGERDPGRKASEKAKAEAEATKTRLRVVGEATVQQAAHLDQLLASDAAQDMARATSAHAAQVYAEALDALLAARESFWAARRTAAYLSGESTKPMWEAPPPRLPIGMLPNGALVSMNGTGSAGGLTGNGEPLDPTPVFQAMREEATPPKPKAPEHGRWRSRQMVNAQGIPEGMVTEWVPDGAA